MKKLLTLTLIVLCSFTIPRDGLVYHSCEGYFLNQTHYINCYNSEKKVPNWVSYKLTKDMVLEESTQQEVTFRTDVENEDISPRPKDYTYSGYDRGHMVPAEDMDHSLEASKSTFLMTNVAAQQASFNRGVWKRLENRVRKWAVTNEEVYVTSGTIFTNRYAYICDSTIAVPNYFYKIILDNYGPEKKMIAFVFKNEASDLPVEKFIVTVDLLEIATGHDFYSTLPDSLEEKLEGTPDLSLWEF